MSNIDVLYDDEEDVSEFTTVTAPDVSNKWTRRLSIVKQKTEEEIAAAQHEDELLAARHVELLAAEQQENDQLDADFIELINHTGEVVLESGWTRPKTKCWVPVTVGSATTLFSLVDPKHHLPLDNMYDEQDIINAILAHKIVAAPNDYYVRNYKTGHWKLVANSRHLVSVARMNLAGIFDNKIDINSGCVNKFIGSGSYLTLTGTAFIPNGGDVFVSGEKLLLNTHKTPVLAYPVGSYAGNEATQMLLEMIAKNLLGDDDPDWINKVYADEASDVKWFFHWLASQYQRAGKALPTCVWLFGAGMGNGKTTLGSYLTTLLGQDNVKRVDTHEFASDWSDWQKDSTFFIMDEVDLGSRKDGDMQIRRLMGSEVITVRKRNEGASEIPAIANYIFFTNMTQPITITSADRRNSFFKTVPSPEAKARAHAVWKQPHAWRMQALYGLAEFLNGIDIDDDLIGTSRQNEHRNEMVSLSTSPLETWLDEEPKFQVNDWYSTDQLWLMYTLYCIGSGGTGDYTYKAGKNAFDKALGRLNGSLLHRHQLTQKQAAGGSRRKGYIKMDFGTTKPDMSEVTFHRDKQIDKIRANYLTAN